MMALRHWKEPRKAVNTLTYPKGFSAAAVKLQSHWRRTASWQLWKAWASDTVIKLISGTDNDKAYG